MANPVSNERTKCECCKKACCNKTFTIPVGNTRITVKVCGRCVVGNPKRTHEWLAAQEKALIAKQLAARPTLP